MAWELDGYIYHQHKNERMLEMNKSTTILSKNVSGGAATVVSQTTTIMTPQDLINLNGQLANMKVNLQNQANAINSRISAIDAQISDNNDLLTQLSAAGADTTSAASGDDTASEKDIPPA